MITITATADIAAAFEKFQTEGRGSFPTDRCLPGQWERENCQEWSEYGQVEGIPAKLFYMFENAECEVEDAGDFPWDAEHVSKIILAEKDEDGQFEDI